MIGTPNAPIPTPPAVRLEIISVDVGDGRRLFTGPVFVVVTTPGEERRFWMLPGEVEGYLVAMRSLWDYLRTGGEVPPSMIRDAAGRLQLGLSPEGLPPEFVSLTQESPRELWFHREELGGILEALERHVATARAAGMLPEPLP
jgi:hypothetical protein